MLGKNVELLQKERVVLDVLGLLASIASKKKREERALRRDGTVVDG